MGVRCENCRNVYFPPRVFCPQCRRLSRLEPVELEGEGEIVTYTVIHTGAEAFEKQTPYIMAIIQLDEGPRLTAQIVDCKPEDVEIGRRVKKVFRQIQEGGKAGLIHYGFKFVLADGD